MIKGHPKPQLPSIKEEKGTLRPDRGDLNLVELAASGDLPQMPDFLTTAGEEVWQDNIGFVADIRLVSKSDTELFGTFCNIAGANRQAWRADEVPPVSSIVEMRRLAEYFGICGAKSRVVKIDKGAGPNGNPFNKFKR